MTAAWLGVAALAAGLCLAPARADASGSIGLGYGWFDDDPDTDADEAGSGVSGKVGYGGAGIQDGWVYAGEMELLLPNDGDALHFAVGGRMIFAKLLTGDSEGLYVGPLIGGGSWTPPTVHGELGAVIGIATGPHSAWELSLRRLFVYGEPDGTVALFEFRWF